MLYKMLTRGGTRGSVTGRNHAWTPGRIIDAPEREFYHLSPRHYEVIETATAVPKREIAAKVGLTKHAKGGGWWEVRRGDEVVFKRQSESAIDEFIRTH